MPRRPSWPAALRIAALAVTACAACGTDASGVDVCKRVEEARCRRAPACGIRLEPPYSTDGDPVAACIRFYDVACLHGLEASAAAPQEVDRCVSAITGGACSVVATPETDPACAWLVPPASPPPDASASPADAGAGDGTDG
jgi:hypothetical protein